MAEENDDTSRAEPFMIRFARLQSTTEGLYDYDAECEINVAVDTAEPAVFYSSMKTIAPGSEDL